MKFIVFEKFSILYVTITLKKSLEYELNQFNNASYVPCLSAFFIFQFNSNDFKVFKYIYLFIYLFVYWFIYLFIYLFWIAIEI